MASEFDNVRQEEIKTRRERRQARVIAKAERAVNKTEKSTVQKKPSRKRLIPIWLRLLIVVTLVVISMIAGLMVGYGVIGDGNVIEALKISTWKHLFDIVYEGT